MAIAFDVAPTGVKWTTNATSKSLDISTAATGSVCYFILSLAAFQTGNTTATTATGWTRISEADYAASRHYAWFYRVKQSGDTTFTVSWPTTTLGHLVFASWTGVNTTTPHEGANFLEHTLNNANWVSGSITPTAADRWIMGMFVTPAGGTTATFTPDAAMTERYDSHNGGASGANHIIEIADTNGAVTAAAHTYTAVLTAANQRGGVVTAALIPAGGGAAGPVSYGTTIIRAVSRAAYR